MTLTANGGWQVTDTSSTIVSQSHWELDANTDQYVWIQWRYREETSITYEISVADTQGFPSSIQDPGGLIAQGYRCEHRGLSRAYGTPLGGTYQEVFVKKGAWTLYS